MRTLVRDAIAQIVSGRRGLLSIATATQEAHSLGDNLCGVAVLAVLVSPLARSKPALDVDLPAFGQIPAARFGLLAPDDDGMPLSRFLTVALAILIGGRSRYAQLRDGLDCGVVTRVERSR